jgi:hypothetical protein
MSEYFCRLCDRTFETIPDGAIQIGRAHGFRHQYQMFLFADRSVHDLKRLNPPPKPDNELLAATIQALLELPTPPQPESETAMSVAFKLFSSKN